MKKNQFKLLDAVACKLLKELLPADSRRNSCELSWSNLQLYQDSYHWHYAYDGNNLWIVSFEAEYILFPLGKYPEAAGLRYALDELTGQEDAWVCGDVPPEYAACCPEAGRFFDIQFDAGEADYIYSLEHLHSFAGGKLRKRHNQVRQFEREYAGRYQVRELTDKDIPQVCQMAGRVSNAYWDSESGQEERAAFGRLAECWQDSLQHLMGIGLWVDDSLVGFSIGSALNEQTVDVHFEKADHAFCGCGAKLTAAMVEYLLEHNWLYMNREQDMNLEGLRRAKQALDPDQLYKRMKICIGK